MIRSLHISNYALIDEVNIELTDGLNIITGETGAGKSIILGALSMLLGERADTRVVTDPERKSIVEAVIDIGKNDALLEFFNINGIDWSDDGICILRREISTNGRSRSFINDSPVNLVILRDLSKQLIDIHSQHQNLLLADHEFQLRIIDAMAGNDSKLLRYKESYEDYRTALKQYSNVKREIEKFHNIENDLSQQLKKIQSLKLKKGEQEELEKEKEVLSNYVSVKNRLNELIESLVRKDNPIIDELRICSELTNDVKGFVKNGKELSDRFNSAYIELKDLAENYEKIDEELTGNPERLNEIEERLNDIYRLEKKYNVESISDLIEIEKEFEKKLNQIDNREEILKNLEIKAKGLRTKSLEIAKEISNSRRKEAEIFSKLLTEKARPLGMNNLKVIIDFKYTTDLTPMGIDVIEFRFGFNKNQEPLSVGNTASGGEISRLMLCIKSIIAHRINLPTVVFDEIDTGVSGEIAARMGELMLDIATGIQVLAITHLPQVAAKGTSHYKVFKKDDEEKTHTFLKQLTDEERVNEISLMLSGTEQHQTAIENARTLLNFTHLK